MSYLNDLFSLNGKVAIVTGAARGNGKAIAQALLGAGAAVVIADILAVELAETADILSKKGSKVEMLCCDIRIKADIKKLIDMTIEWFGRIDVLVNNAGVTHPNSVFEYSDSDWEDTYKVNLKAPFDLSREAAKYMKDQACGSIINITSLNAELAFPNNPAYVAFKGALKQLTKSLALDLGKYGIRVNNVGPGYFKTNMTQKSWSDSETRKRIAGRTMLDRWGQPNDIAGVVVLLASDASSYITGQDIYVDGGWLAKGL